MFNHIETSDECHITYKEFISILPLLNRWGVVINYPGEVFKTINKDGDGAGTILFNELVKWIFGWGLETYNGDDGDGDSDNNIPVAPYHRLYEMTRVSYNGSSPQYRRANINRLATPKFCGSPLVRRKKSGINLSI